MEDKKIEKENFDDKKEKNIKEVEHEEQKNKQRCTRGCFSCER